MSEAGNQGSAWHMVWSHKTDSSSELGYKRTILSNFKEENLKYWQCQGF